MLTILQLLLFWISFDFVYIIYRAYLLIIQKRKLSSANHSLISILIPAYNEEVCIEKTLKSCLHQTYPRKEVIVVDDGSTDNTLKKVKDFISKNKNTISKKQLTIKTISQKNQGKAKALNTAKRQALGQILVTIDADSHLHSHALDKIIKYFSSKEIGAVAGNVIAVSNKSLLGYLQKIEYELGVHFIRNSQSAIGNVMVTPGALSAYKRDAISHFEEGTLTEDFDSSVRILEKGYKIVMAPDALCYTQVPLSIGQLIKQRIRWQQGGIEVFAKHIFHKKRKSVTIEWIFLFIFGFYALFSKIIALFVVPLFTNYQGLTTALTYLGLFYTYSIIIYVILFSFVYHYSHHKKSILAVPLFIIYYHTIVLYSVLVAQILALKGVNKHGKKSTDTVSK